MTTERLERILKRWRKRDDLNDAGTWRGLHEIALAHGGDKYAVRGLLIKLVARGAVEVFEAANGVFWRGVSA